MRGSTFPASKHVGGDCREEAGTCGIWSAPNDAVVGGTAQQQDGPPACGGGGGRSGDRVKHTPPLSTPHHRSKGSLMGVFGSSRYNNNKRNNVLKL